VPNRSLTFREIFRASDPLASPSFRLLSEAVAKGGGHQALQEFFIALNRELSDPLASGDGHDAARARHLFVALLHANSVVALGVLQGLFNDLQLCYHDPLVAVVFDAAAEARPLLSLMAELMETESQFLECRARAVEAFVTRSPGGLGVGDLEFEAQSMLQFLNARLDDLGRGSAGDFEQWHTRWTDGLKRISGLLLDGQAFSLGPRPYDAESVEATDDGPAVLQAMEGAFQALSSTAISDAIPLVLRILKANTPLPPWHALPAINRTRERVAVGGAGTSPGGAGDGRKVLALVVDKTMQILFGMASLRWRSDPRAARDGRARRHIVLSPFNQRTLESTLLDSTQVPRTRAVAAGLLRVLAPSWPSEQLSPRARIYAELFLNACQPAELGTETATPRRLPGVDSRDVLDVLLDALDDACRRIRNAACEACWSVALEHPGWFQPRHYTRLLPCLSDDDRGVRVSVMRAFQALAGYRSQRVAVLQSMATRLDGEPDDDEEKGARRDLEIALGITLDRLVDDVEQLQQEVQGLEARRRELLDHIEGQAVRVSEEIHHEVLNALGGYLATAIDEEDYPEAKRRLDDLVAELRRIMNNLYPVDLATEGFLQTIRNRLRAAHAHMERRATGLQVDLVCAPGITDEAIVRHAGGSSHLVLLYRIVVEGISNARKHSGGTRIAVQMDTTPEGAIEIAIVDNGAGGGGPFTEGVGMALMRQRAEEIGAAIRYTTAPREGTTVVIRLSRSEAGASRRDDRRGRWGAVAG